MTIIFGEIAFQILTVFLEVVRSVALLLEQLGITDVMLDVIAHR